MNKEEFTEWLSARLRTQEKLTIAASAAMAGLGLLAFLFQGGILYLLISCGYSPFTAALFVVGGFGAIGVFVWTTAPSLLHDEEVSVATKDGSDIVRVSPNMAAVWTFALGSLESSQSIPEKLFGMLMLVPRLFWTSIYVFRRYEQVREIDAESCASVLRLLLKKAERVDADEIMEKRPKLDFSRTLHQMSLIDGIVFLTKDGLGLTVATRLTDEIAATSPQSLTGGPFD